MKFGGNGEIIFFFSDQIFFLFQKKKRLSTKTSIISYYHSKMKLLESENMFNVIYDRYQRIRVRLTKEWRNDLNFKIYHFFENCLINPEPYLFFNALTLLRVNICTLEKDSIVECCHSLSWGIKILLYQASLIDYSKCIFHLFLFSIFH